MRNRHLPTFLILGAYKSGTTSLHHYLGQHPQIYMSRIKELRFLTHAGHQIQPMSAIEYAALPWRITELTAYEALFAPGSGYPARGDISPCYLAFPHQSILGIRRYVPDAKLIAILRQPAERAYSSYVGSVRGGREEEMDFRRCLDLEAKGIVRKLDGRQRREYAEGFYADALTAYFASFPKHQIRIFLYDDLKSDPVALLREMLGFIGVDDSFVPDMSQRHNPGQWPRLPLARRLGRSVERAGLRAARMLKWLGFRQGRAFVHSLLYSSPPPLDVELYRELTAAYRDDILRTQELIQRDLSHWLI